MCIVKYQPETFTDNSAMQKNRDLCSDKDICFDVVILELLDLSHGIMSVK